MQTLAASARLWANLVEAAVHIAVELKNAAPGLMAAVSPNLPNQLRTELNVKPCLDY